MPETPAKKRLRELKAAEKRRRGGKFTQADLSREADVPLGNIEKYESGHSTPDRDNAVKLARFYGVSVEELLGSEEKGRAPESVLITDPEAPDMEDRVSTAEAIIHVVGKAEYIRQAFKQADRENQANLGYILAQRHRLPPDEMEKILAWRRRVLQDDEDD